MQNLRMKDLSALHTAMLELRCLLARPDNDFSWSSWPDTAAALTEVDQYISWISKGSVPDLSILLVPTGPAQEVSISSGWAHEYLAVAERIECALAHHRRAEPAQRIPPLD